MDVGALNLVIPVTIGTVAFVLNTGVSFPCGQLQQAVTYLES